MDPWTVFQIIYLSCIGVFGTIGNSLVIIAVLTTRSLRHRSYFFIVFLAVWDLCTSSVSVPFYVLTLCLGRWPFDVKSCVFLGFSTLWSLGLSITTLAMIAADRYIYVTHLRQAYVTFCSFYTIALTIFGQFLLGMGTIMLPMFIGIGRMGFNPVLGHCTYVYTNTTEWIYPLIMFLGGVVSSMLTLPAYYAMTFSVVRTSRIRINNAPVRQSATRSNLTDPNRAGVTRDQPLNKRNTISRGELRFTRKLLLLFVLFLLCWLPYSVVVFSDSQLTVPVLVQRLTNMLLWSSAAVNPFLYAWMMRRFRKAYVRILTCGWVRRIEPSSSRDQTPSIAAVSNGVASANV